MDLARLVTRRQLAEDLRPSASGRAPHGDYFDRIVTAFRDQRRARSGPVGHAHALLLDARALHRFAVEWMEANLAGPEAR